MKKVLNKSLLFLEIFLIVIITITFFLVAYNFFQLRVQNKDYVNLFGYSVFEVVSNSMAPTIEKKDIIFVKIDSDIKIDDVITYKSEEAFVTHRVVEESRDQYITRGDANNSKDVPIEKENVVGKVVFVASGLGVWRQVLMSPPVLISIVVTVGILNLLLAKNPENIAHVKFNKKCKDFRISRENLIEECGDNLDR